MRYEQFTVNQLTAGTINGFPYPGRVGMGEAFYLVAADSATSLYRSQLVANGVDPSKIFATLATAEAAMSAYRNDTLYIFPGDHAVTASITWDKSVTNIVGVGSINQRFQPSTLTVGGVRIKCVTTGIDNILNITGDYVSMYNIGTFNSFDIATNVCDIKIAGRNFYAEDCSFRGGNGATQVATNTAGVPLYFNTAVAGAGNAALLKHCVIGSSGNTNRTLGAGCAYFKGGAAAGFSVTFEDCEFHSRISTANADDSCLILLDGNYAVDRGLLFKGCFFYNFVENLASKLDFAIHDNCGTTHMNVLMGCACAGIDAWSNTTTYTYVASGPAQHAEGGIAVVGDVS
jgi:hypothetical protein